METSHYMTEARQRKGQVCFTQQHLPCSSASICHIEGTQDTYWQSE